MKWHEDDEEYQEFLKEQHPEFDSETEKVLGGTQLREGMIVLPGNPDRREKFDDWAEIVRIIYCATGGATLNPDADVSFIARHNDGTKNGTEKRHYALIKYKWLVKIDSFPEVRLRKKRETLLKSLLLKNYKIGPVRAERDAVAMVELLEALG